jgi:hypothetical protein
VQRHQDVDDIPNANPDGNCLKYRHHATLTDSHAHLYPDAIPNADRLAAPHAHANLDTFTDDHRYQVAAADADIDTHWLTTADPHS